MLLPLPEMQSTRQLAALLPAVEGTLQGFPFRAALEVSDSGNVCVRLAPGLLQAARIPAGEPARMEITRIGDEPECRLPAELAAALSATPAAHDTWRQTTPRARRDWILWICSARQPHTRLTRIDKARSMLAEGKRRVCCFGGLAWLIQDHPDAGETWIDLPTP